MAAAEAKDVKPDQTVSEEKEEAQPRGGGSLLVDIEGTPIRVTALASTNTRRRSRGKVD